MPQQDNLSRILEEGVPPGLAYWMGRIDTRVSELITEVHKLSSGFATKGELGDVKEDVSELKDVVNKHLDNVEVLKKQYVTKEEYKLVKSLVFGFVALILLAFMGVLISFFIPGV